MQIEPCKFRKWKIKSNISFVDYPDSIQAKSNEVLFHLFEISRTPNLINIIVIPRKKIIRSKLTSGRTYRIYTRGDTNDENNYTENC